VNISGSRYNDHEGKPAGMLVVLRDTSDRKRLEVQLQQAQKMEAVGTLAGGIAHDFNNILGIIIGNTDIALYDMPEWNPARHNLDEIRKASFRARDLVKQILAFSRQSVQEKIPLKMSHIVNEALKMLRASLPTTIEIRQDIDPKSGTILGDPTQLHQVLMNLCTNASHAMQEEGGILGVSLVNRDIDRKEAAGYAELKPGPYIRLTVSDTGKGIDPGVIDRIFDPYFTTKGVGEGTGMGLAVIHGIVNKYGGAITVNSGVGKGTTFHLLFPRVEKEVSQEIETPSPLPRGNESILFVDDEKAVVITMQGMLENLGYRVTARTSSIETLQAFRNNPDAFDLVITDQTMPNMTGKELAKKLLQLRPGIPIILCTGYSEQIDAEKAKEMGISAFVMKPIDMSKIADTIRKVLDEK